MTLPQLFDLSLVGRRDQPALDWDRTYTFGEIDDRASRMAQALVARGVRPGDRVCVYLANCLEYIDLYLAITRLGAIFVPVNILYRDREIRHILNDAAPVGVIAREEDASLIPDAWWIEDLAREAGRMPATRIVNVKSGDDAAAIVYTSGTTGTSKGAVLSHNVFAINAINLLTCWAVTAADRFLLTLPLFHVHGLGNGIHCWLLSGCRMKLVERFESRQIGSWMQEFRPTLFFGVPTMYVRLLDLAPEIAQRVGADMRLFVSGSAPLPAHVLEQFRGLYGHTILERYGMSETLMNMSNPYVGERRPGSVGFPLPGVCVKLSETGEVLLQGPNLFSGYWNNPQATAAAFEDGWFKTGDLASCSDDGYYTLQGRRSDLIISGGFNIYPREIEEFLLEQPGIAEAAVAGVPDPARGELPVAYIVIRPGSVLDTSELESACRASLASFKVPRKFVQVDKLPRTALGKIQKHLLPTPN